MKMQFRKKSLLVHPDKNTDPRAQDAFERLKEAEKALKDTKTIEILIEVLREAKMMLDDDIRQERKKVNDDEYFVLLKLKVRGVFEDAKRRAEIRFKNEVERAKNEAEEGEKKRKREQEQSKAWEKVPQSELCE